MKYQYLVNVHFFFKPPKGVEEVFIESFFLTDFPKQKVFVF